MPGGDRTGPGGMGPMTGRAAGFCAGYPVPGYANTVGAQGYGIGFGCGGGRGRGGWGRRNQYYATGLTGWQRAAPDAAALSGYYGAPGAPYGQSFAPPTREQQAEMLRGQAEYLGDQLSGIQKRIEELEKEKK